jgi:hypothetical protein
MLSQTYGRALNGDAEEEWSNLVETITNWDHNTIKTVMKRKLQEHVMKVLGKKVFDQQQDAIEAGMVKPQGMGHVEGIKRLFAMNDKMKMLTKNGESYSQAIMAKKIIYKALQGVARVKYVDKGGRNKTDKEEILDIMEEIEDLLEVEREVEAEARQSF